MPLYEYQCDKCLHRFEVIQKFADPPIDVCPQCGGAVKKLLSSPAIQFKGTGWYITDYARKGDTGGGAGAPSDSAATESKAETKTDAKTEAKTETKTETAKTE